MGGLELIEVAVRMVPLPDANLRLEYSPDFGRRFGYKPESTHKICAFHSSRGNFEVKAPTKSMAVARLNDIHSYYSIPGPLVTWVVGLNYKGNTGTVVDIRALLAANPGSYNVLYPIPGVEICDPEGHGKVLIYEVGKISIDVYSEDDALVDRIYREAIRVSSKPCAFDYSVFVAGPLAKPAIRQ